MSDEKVGYARREFLGQCLAAPVAAKAILSGSAVVASESPSKAAAPVVASTPVDLEREVESLLKLVDPQVVYRRVPVPAEKNAWPLWKKAHDAYVKQPEGEEYDEMVSRVFEGGKFPTGELRKQLLDWIDRNEDCRRLMDEGIKLGAMELPRATSSRSLPIALDEIHLFRTLGQLRTLTSRAAIEAGDFEFASREAFACLEFAKVLLASECMLVDFLVAIAVLGIGVSSVCEFSTAENVPDQLARESIKLLAACRVGKDVVKRAYRVEYCRWILPYLAAFPNDGSTEELVKHYMFGLSEPAPDYKPSERQQQENDRAVRDISFVLEGHKNPFDKDATTRLGSFFYVHLFEEIDKNALDRNFDFVAQIRAETAAWPEEAELNFMDGILLSATRRPTKKELLKAREQLRAVDNALGKRIVVQFISVFADSAIERNGALLESARLRIALRFYERKHGRLPETLAALVDDGLLPEVPKDPFDSKEFKYSAKRRVIWSIGTEGTNDGVIPEPEDPEEQFNEGLEMTWRI